MILALIIMSAIDVVCTGIAVKRNYGQELNPVMRKCFEKLGVIPTCMIGLILNLAVALALYSVIEYEVVRYMVMFLNGTRFIACLIHLHWIIEVLRGRAKP